MRSSILRLVLVAACVLGIVLAATRLPLVARAASDGLSTAMIPPELKDGIPSLGSAWSTFADPTPQPIRVADPTPARPATGASTAEEPLGQVVASAVAELDGTYGVAVLNLNTGETTLLHGNDFFPSASLYKLAVMYEVFRQQQAGTLSLDEVVTVQPSDMDDSTDDDVLAAGDQLTIQKALELMIDVSSNAAGHALADRVGWDQVNQSMTALGLNQTRLPVGAWKAQLTDWRSDTASTSPADMLAFFTKLYHHQLINPSASDQMLQLLLNQQINDRIPAELPADTAVAHKTGNLEGVVNDAGIVYGPRTDFILVVLSQDADDGVATSTEADLARTLYQRFENASPPRAWHPGVIQFTD